MILYQIFHACCLNRTSPLLGVGHIFRINDTNLAMPIVSNPLWNEFVEVIIVMDKRHGTERYFCD